MREILFRAKAVNRERNSERRTDYKNGDWVYGLISKEYDERFPNLPAEMTDKAGVSGIEVDYQSIGEYTGLNDKYGVRIFEGDIIKTNNNIIGAVEWNDTFAKYYVCYNQISGNWFDFEGEDCFPVALDCVIIGNIFDNTELLEEKNGE